MLGDKARIICAWIGGAGWMLLAVVAFYLAFECLDWLSSRRIPFSEAHFGRVWRVTHAVLSVHPFAGPFLVLMIAWAPTLIASLPGLFMGDTGAQIRQWFNYPNGTSDYLRLLNPNVLLNGHHPVVHTAIIGSCVQLGLSLFNSSANAGSCHLHLCSVRHHGRLHGLFHFVAAQTGCEPAGSRCDPAVLFAFMPMFSNYAALLTKDVLFADAFLVLLVQTVKLVACGLPRIVMPMLSERARKPPCSLRATTGCCSRWLPWVPRFLRNGGLVFPLAACVIAAAFCAWDVHVARRAAKQTGAAPSGAIPRFRWIGVLAVLALCLASNMYFTKVFMPAHDITPGSKREILSIPFQQTARFVQKARSGLNSGVNPTVKEDGTIVEAPCGGLVTDEERAVIDRVLKYENLGRRYNPDKSDAVKNCFNEYASQEDIKDYFEVWAQMFKKDPGVLYFGAYQ